MANNVKKNSNKKTPWDMSGNPAEIVRIIRDLERFEMEFKTFITLTYRKEPLGNFRGCENATIKRICRTLMGKDMANCVFLALEEDEKRKHFHLAIDKIVTINYLRKYWKYGYVQVDKVRMHTSVKYYLYKAMRSDRRDNYRLYYRRERILETFLERFQLLNYK